MEREVDAVVADHSAAHRGSARIRSRSRAALQRAGRAARVGAIAGAAFIVACAGPEPVREAAEVAPAPPWQELFDGRDLSSWKAGVFGEFPEFDQVEDGVVIPQGVPLAGLTYQGEPPTPPFEAEFDVTKEFGADFFFSVTFPVRGEHLTLVLGGWGGVVCGLSCLDGEDASGNDTRTLRNFPDGTRYRVSLVVSDDRVRVDLDGERLIDADLRGRELELRPEVDPSVPFGVAAFATQTVLHRVRVRQLGADGFSP
ncbi:DUF1080 domain-containing protein [Planctomycetota bacterium]|nr:DUF1080 domain-containing protein [Planctomycetota bacterium]